MKICLITKYPPLIGGLSSRTYWSVELLSKAGVIVDIVSNSLEADDRYRTLNIDCFNSKHEGNNVRIHQLNPERKINYIPYANPYVSRLSSLAINVIQEKGCDLIHANYFEPNAVAACLVSQQTDIPFGVAHAGSDIGYMYNQNELHGGYRETLRSANYLLISNPNISRLVRDKVDADKMFTPYCFYPLKDYFNPGMKKMDLQNVAKLIYSQLTASRLSIANFYTSFDTRSFDQGIPTIAVYGKASAYKGYDKLIVALGLLKKRGYKFNFIFITQGSLSYLKSIEDLILLNKIENNTLVLPFLPHYMMPSFIRACDVICYLEHNFPIPNHSPIIPNEVFSCGTCLLISEDIARSYPELAKYCMIANMQDNEDLYFKLEETIKNLKKAKTQAILGYRDIIEPLHFDCEYHSKKLMQFYEKLMTFARRSKRLQLSLKLAKSLTIEEHAFIPAADSNHAKCLNALNKQISDEAKIRFYEFFKRFFKITCLVIDDNRLIDLVAVYFKNNPELHQFEISYQITVFLNYTLLLNDQEKYISEVAYDVLTYEFECFKLIYTSPALAKSSRNQSNLKLNDYSLIPYISPLVSIFKINSNVIEFLPELISGKVTNKSTPRNRTTYMIKYSPTTNKFKCFKANLNTEFLLSSIDGKNSLENIIKLTKLHVEKNLNKGQFHNYLNRLYDEEIILFA